MKGWSQLMRDWSQMETERRAREASRKWAAKQKQQLEARRDQAARDFLAALARRCRHRAEQLGRALAGGGDRAPHIEAPAIETLSQGMGDRHQLHLLQLSREAAAVQLYCLRPAGAPVVFHLLPLLDGATDSPARLVARPGARLDVSPTGESSIILLRATARGSDPLDTICLQLFQCLLEQLARPPRSDRTRPAATLR